MFKRKMSMKELKIGERILLEVQEVENISCPSCFFFYKEIGCTDPIVECFAYRRSDKKNVIFKEVNE